MTIEAHKKIRRFDKISGAPRAISHEHGKLHDGDVYTFSSQTSLAMNGKHYIALTNPASESYHLTTARVQPTGGPIVVKLYEAPFLDANSMGTETVLINRYRPLQATKVASLQVHLDPFVDVNSLGMAMETQLLPATNLFVSSGEDFPFEWVLALGNQYIVEIENQNNAAIQLVYTPFIYETGVV